MTHISTIIQARISIPVASPMDTNTDSRSRTSSNATAASNSANRTHFSSSAASPTMALPSESSDLASEIVKRCGDAKRAREILQAEAAAILSIAERLDAEMNAVSTRNTMDVRKKGPIPTQSTSMSRSDISCPDMSGTSELTTGTNDTIDTHTANKPNDTSCLKHTYSMVASFHAAVQLVSRCHGDVVVTGIGKAGHIGRKISATLASTGTRSFFLHPAEAVHGDLGRLGPEDIILALSQSGETEEMTRLLSFFSQQEIPVIAITGRHESRLGRAARVVLELGQIPEACRLDLAPSSSTTAMLAMGDALALVVSELKQFERDDFSKFHPAGNLGKRLAKVDDFARALMYCRVASDSLSIRDVFTTHVMPGRRSGAMMLTDATGRLTGIFTDSDLAKLFELRQETMLDRAIREVMTHSPLAVRSGAPITDAVQLMARRKISELPVVDAENRPIGLIDITDLLAAFPNELAEQK